MQLPLKISAFSRWHWSLAVLIILVLGGYFFFGNGNGQEATLAISSGDFREQVSVSGTVIAARDVALGFAANGRLARAYAEVGQQVAQGTVLAEIENGDLVATLTQKQSVLAGAEADLSSLRSGTRPEELSVAAASVANAKAALLDAIQSAYTSSDDAIHNKSDALFANPRTNPNLGFAVSNASLEAGVESQRAAIEPMLAEWALLVDALAGSDVTESARQSQAYLARITTFLADMNVVVNHGVPDAVTTAATLASHVTTLATARTNVNSAVSALTTDSTALNSAQKNLLLKQAGSTDEAIRAQESTVAAAAADVESARALLAKTRVTAPFSGIVTRMDAKVGETVSSDASKIAMQSDGIFQIETYVPEVAIARVAVGNPATTTLDAYGSSVEFASIVIAVDPAETVKDGVPAYKTTLAFLTKDARIRSGMTANVIIETGMLDDAIVIPAGAVGTKDGAPYVSVLYRGETESRRVTTGASPMLGQAHILSGLSAGDVILLAPAP